MSRTSVLRAAQLAGQPRHCAGAVDTGRGRIRPAPVRALPDDHAGCAVHLLRGRDRPVGGHRSGLPRRVSLGAEAARGTTHLLQALSAARSACDTSTSALRAGSHRTVYAQDGVYGCVRSTPRRRCWFCSTPTARRSRLRWSMRTRITEGSRWSGVWNRGEYAAEGRSCTMYTIPADATRWRL